MFPFPFSVHFNLLLAKLFHVQFVVIINNRFLLSYIDMKDSLTESWLSVDGRIHGQMHITLIESSLYVNATLYIVAREVNIVSGRDHNNWLIPFLPRLVSLRSCHTMTFISSRSNHMKTRHYINKKHLSWGRKCRCKELYFVSKNAWNKTCYLEKCTRLSFLIKS